MAPPSWLTVKNQDIIISVHAQPGAKRSAVVGEYGERLKIAIACPPVDGKAIGNIFDDIIGCGQPLPTFKPQKFFDGAAVDRNLAPTCGMAVA